MSNGPMKDLAKKSLEEEISSLEQRLIDLRAAQSTLEAMTNEQIASVVSIQSLYQRLVVENVRQKASNRPPKV
jgi:hypothetical protein